MEDFLTDESEDAYGAGNELPTTGFLIFGILTLWIYTVYKYHAVLRQHFEMRHNLLKSKLNLGGLDPADRGTVESLCTKGFCATTGARNVTIASYGACVVILLAEIVFQQLLAQNRLSLDFFDRFTIAGAGLAAALFCGATIYFLLWVCRVMQQHEFNELLLVRFVDDPGAFKMMHPSRKFVDRWRKNQNVIAFFLVIAIPIVVSPYIAVRQSYAAIETPGKDFALVILAGSLVVFALGGIFHVWGTKVLLSMFNGHLCIEKLNAFAGQSRFADASGASAAVLSELPGAPMSEPAGHLLPRRSLAAIMLTDVVGFSRQMEQDETATYAKLMVHNEIIRDCLKRNDGQEIKTIGDAFLVRFQSAVDAVKTAVEIQNRLAGYNADKAEVDRLLVRIGIHIGDILMMDGDIFGNGVNIVSRIEPLAEPGGICISADVYNVVKKSIEVKAIAIGRKELKNIKDAPEIYKIIVDTAEK